MTKINDVGSNGRTIGKMPVCVGTRNGNAGRKPFPGRRCPRMAESAVVVVIQAYQFDLNPLAARITTRVGRIRLVQQRRQWLDKLPGVQLDTSLGRMPGYFRPGMPEAVEQPLLKFG